MIVNSTTYDHTPLTLRTWLDDPVVLPFKVSHHERAPHEVTEIVVHEPAVNGWHATQRALERRGLGCQLMIDHDGSVTQHGDLVDRMAHAGDHNAPSIGIEVINPYEPDKRGDETPWRNCIDAPWAHGKRYVLPTPAQCEALTLVIDQITTCEALSVPRIWRGLVEGRWQLRKMPKAPKRPKQAARAPGIWSHQQVGNHSDGGWPLLYAWMRLEAGLSPQDSYAEARSRASGVRRDLGLLDLMV